MRVGVLDSVTNSVNLCLLSLGILYEEKILEASMNFISFGYHSCLFRFTHLFPFEVVMREQCRC